MEQQAVKTRNKRKEKGTVYLIVKSVRGVNKLAVKVKNASAGVEVGETGISKIGGFTQEEYISLINEMFNPEVPRWEN